MKYFALLFALFIASCASRPKPQITVRPLSAPAVEPIESVRYPETVRAYHIRRYVDPNHPSTMHEQHPVYRVEASERWNLHPGPLGPSASGAFEPPRNAAFAPPPTNDVVIAELNRQRQTTELVMWEANRLAQSFGELQKVLTEMKGVAQNHILLMQRFNQADERVAAIEAHLRRLITPRSSPTNDAPEPPKLNP